MKRMRAPFAIAALPVMLAAQTASQPVTPVLDWVSSISDASGTTQVKAVGTDASGNLYITGNTASTDFPVKFAAQPKPGGSGDVFVVKLPQAK